MTFKQINICLSLAGAAGFLTALRHAPKLWEIDPMSTTIAVIAIIYTCISIVGNAFEWDEKDD